MWVILLAYNCRLGVFSEHGELLRDSLEGILEQEEVQEALVITLDGRLIAWQGKGNKRPSLKEVESLANQLQRVSRPLYLDKGLTMEFWAPVKAHSGEAKEESLFFEEEQLTGGRRIIGLVGLRVDKRFFYDKLRNLLVKSILIGLIHLLLASLVTMYIVRSLTEPLNRLATHIKAFGQGQPVGEIPMETGDEIGHLAMTFNNMLESLKKREKEKESLEKQLAQAQKMEAIGTLAGGVAHDFNNILSAIIGYASLVLMDLEETSPFREGIEHIISSANRAAEITKSLLAFSRRQVLDPRQVNLNRIVRDTGKLIQRLIGDNIEMIFSLSQEELPVLVDFTHITQVLMNLTINARDAMPQGGTLILSTQHVPEGREGGPYALLTISDTGVGMEKNVQERIFDPFYTTKEVGKGTGLGLSIVYGLVKQHHGYIEVSSKVGVGTQFRIYLPLTQLMTKEEEDIILPGKVRGTETVLLAEDDQEVNKLSREILERSGYRVIYTFNGQEAVQRFKEKSQEISLLLFDVGMRKMSGQEAYEEIKKIKPKIKVLFMSGYDQQVIKTMNQNQKTTPLANPYSNYEDLPFITKPISPAILLQEVRKLLDFDSN